MGWSWQNGLTRARWMAWESRIGLAKWIGSGKVDWRGKGGLVLAEWTGSDKVDCRMGETVPEKWRHFGHVTTPFPLGPQWALFSKALLLSDPARRRTGSGEEPQWSIVTTELKSLNLDFVCYVCHSNCSGVH